MVALLGLRNHEMPYERSSILFAKFHYPERMQNIRQNAEVANHSETYLYFKIILSFLGFSYILITKKHWKMEKSLFWIRVKIHWEWLVPWKYIWWIILIKLLITGRVMCNFFLIRSHGQFWPGSATLVLWVSQCNKDILRLTYEVFK